MNGRYSKQPVLSTVPVEGARVREHNHALVEACNFRLVGMVWKPKKIINKRSRDIRLL